MYFIAIFKRLSEVLYQKSKKNSVPKASLPQVAKVTKVIKGPYIRGRVKFKDRYFHAFCTDAVEIARGAYVEVVENRETFLIVRPLFPM